jgi:hypothetical protein
MMLDETSSTRSEEAMVAGGMTNNAANHGTRRTTAARICRAGRPTDGDQKRGCRNDH